MTFERFKSLAKALLAGDVKLSKDDDEVIALLEYAFSTINDKADALHLLTMNQTEDIHSMGPGNYLKRKPTLPATDEDELDIDNELCFAAARYVASFMSKNKPQIHEREALKIIADYNSKVYQVMESVKVEGGQCAIK